MGYLSVLFKGTEWFIFQFRGKASVAPLPLILRMHLYFPACPAGMFKASQEAEVCSHCPSNSRSPSEASPICTCRTGYYRADFDPPEVACTSKCIVGALGWGVRLSDSASGGPGAGKTRHLSLIARYKAEMLAVVLK